MIEWLINSKGYERKRPRPILRQYPDICQELGEIKTEKKVNQKKSPGRDANQGTVASLELQKL